MQYQIKELPEQKGWMPQRSTDGKKWNDGVPVPAATLPMAHLYVSSMQQFDANDSDGVVVWSSDWPEPTTSVEERTVTRFEDFLK
jgi:hypothetical protein